MNNVDGDSPQVPGRLQGTLGTVVGTLIAGVPILIATPFITKILNDAIAEQGVSSAALAVVLYIIAFGAPFVVLVFIVRSFINKRLRMKVWGWWIRWGLSLSTSKQRQRKLDTEVELAEKNAMKEGKRAGFKLAAEKMRPLVDSYASKTKVIEAERDELKKDLETALTTLKQQGQDFPPPAVALPPLEPRWALVPVQVEPEEHGPRYRRWKLVNMAEDSAAYNVRVDASAEGRLRHTDGATWKDMSGRTERMFGGELSEVAARDGFNLIVWWTEGDPSYHPSKEYVPPSEDVWGEHV